MSEKTERKRGEFSLLKEMRVSLGLILEFIAVALIVLLAIGFFNTPFDKGKAQPVDSELLKERDYVELMNPAIERFTEETLKVKDVAEKYSKGKIVPLKATQAYSDAFERINVDYNKLSSYEVPERFKQFHVSFLKSMEYQGAAINEVLVYLKDKEDSRIDNIDKYNAQFVSQYNDSINLYNRLLKERVVK